MGKDLLLEIGSEEIPARSIPPLLAEVEQKFEQMLRDLRLGFDAVQTFGSARRLVVYVNGLADQQQTETVRTLGPPENVAFRDGRPSKALEGFARKSGVEVNALKVFETERGRYVGFESEAAGRQVSEVLSEEIPQIVRSLTFPKAMYWTDSGERFARPVRWVVALRNSTVLPLELYGVRAGAESAGHRVMGSQSVSVSGFEDYLAKLEQNGVLVSQARRQAKIEKELEAAARDLNARIVSDDDLLEEVLYINEYPTVILGAFENRFLELPREVLITVMREHQKYFALEGKDGVLLPNFLAVINTREDASGLIRKGHERVLKARLSDALFFWEVDGKRSLEQRVPLLDTIVFHSALGTYGDKVTRMMKLASTVNWITHLDVNADVLRSAVRWSKADLTTDLVGEFPDLQGIVGGLYARREGASEEIATAIYDQYRPAGLEDDAPSSHTGIVLSLTDRLDTVFGCFSVGLVPTGSEDPLGLRRQTQAVIKILIEGHLDFSLQAAIEADGRMDAAAVNRFRGFFKDRMRHVLDLRDFAYDEINAVLATDSDSPANILDRVEALRQIRKSPDFLAPAAAFKRIKNILKQSSDTGGAPLESPSRTGMEPEEAALADRIGQIEPQVREWAHSGAYARALETMASLRPLVDQFFDKILVMHEDPVVRGRRLHLLRRLFDTFLQIADVSEVVVS